MPKRTHELSRRDLMKGAAVAGIGATLLSSEPAQAVSIDSLTARPPDGFEPLTVPGKVVKVTKGNDFASLMQKNELWPKPEVARQMLERAMTEFTGASNLDEAMKKFVHKDDVVAIKVNGIAGQKGYTMAANFELILPTVEAVIAAGVPAGKITVYEQFPTFLKGCRVTVKGYDLPKGVKTGYHGYTEHPMPEVAIYQGIKTKYSKFMLEATCVIALTMIKDHSLAGYTGTLKNITHGNINNPQDHHAHTASPQIAMLYNHPIPKSRVRLQITDAYKIIYDKGPLDRDPRTRIPHGAVYVATDPVAMDTIGWKVVDEERKKHGLKSLKDSKREPRYIKTAAELGLGIHDLNQIRLKSVAI